MAQWRIKEISDLTKISIRMLRHYDELGLLKPSMRTSNGYRWYCEADLAKLQRIVALKFFGFSLSEIKTMVQEDVSIKEGLKSQQKMLADQVKELRLALDTLGFVLQEYQKSDSLDWKQISHLIERYRMAEEIKNTFAKNLSEKQKDSYLTFRQSYLSQAKAWEETVEALNHNKLDNPEGPEGERVIKTFLAFSQANMEWGKEYNQAKQRMTQDDAGEINTLIAKHVDCFKTQSKEGAVLNFEGSMWFTKALIAHQLRGWQEIYQEISKNLDADPESNVGKKLATKWRDFIAEHTMGGNTDFFLGTKLLMESANSKAVLSGQAAPQLFDDMKLLKDLIAMDWINRALQAHD
ncbi:MAG TPA: MerR family transcriptional regulator [Candidatus Babeliales bacterium]|nr:MerR family transcriptional regulator [Candidatus Babeliales bacterium]